MRVQATGVLALTFGLVSPALADTGLYVVGEAGSHRLNLDTSGAVNGINQLTYAIGESETAQKGAFTVGGGYDFDLGDSPFTFGAEGLFTFESGERNSSIAVGGSQGFSYLVCQGAALAADGSCPGTTQTNSLLLTDAQAFELTNRVDYTAVALLTVGATFDRFRVTAGAGPALANVNVSYSATELTRFVPAVNAQGYRNGNETVTVTLPAESYDQSERATGWAARAGVDYLLNDRLSLGVVYQYADYGEADFSSARLANYEVGVLGSQLQLRLRASF